MNKRVLRRVAFGCLCFVAPIVMLCVACARAGVYPFGQQTFLSEDLLYQYRDFYEWYIRVLNGEASVLYDPNTGMGTNAWGIYSYYLASPVNLLLPFFGGDRITRSLCSWQRRSSWGACVQRWHGTSGVGLGCGAR